MNSVEEVSKKLNSVEEVSKKMNSVEEVSKKILTIVWRLKIMLVLASVE